MSADRESIMAILLSFKVSKCLCQVHSAASCIQRTLLVQLRQPVWCDLSQLGFSKVSFVVRKPRQLGPFPNGSCCKSKLRSLENSGWSNRKQAEAIRRSWVFLSLIPLMGDAQPAMGTTDTMVCSYNVVHMRSINFPRRFFFSIHRFAPFL